MSNLKLSHSAIEWTWLFGEKNGYTWNPGKGCQNDCTDTRFFFVGPKDGLIVLVKAYTRT
jgi:hypothetical protein